MTERYRPELTGVLNKFQAPPEARSSIIRRAGLAVEGGGVPIKKVEAVIEDSMVKNGGVPNWPEVSTAVGQKVNDFYRKLRR